MMSCFEIRIEAVIMVPKTAIHFRLAVEADKHFLKEKNVHAISTFLIRSSSGQRKNKICALFWLCHRKKPKCRASWTQLSTVSVRVSNLQTSAQRQVNCVQAATVCIGTEVNWRNLGSVQEITLRTKLKLRIHTEYIYSTVRIHVGYTEDKFIVQLGYI